MCSSFSILHHYTATAKEELITAIATIISDFRQGELPFKLDAEHVRKWIDQFAPEEQVVVLQETLHILSNQFFKEERIDDFLRQVVECLAKKASLEAYIFVQNQKKGQSQKIIYEKVQAIYIEDYGRECNCQSDNFTRHDVEYVYIDDGLYTGGRAREDLSLLIDSLPQGVTVDVFYMIAYSNGCRYTEEKIRKKAAERNISVCFQYGRLFYNDRNCVSKQIDIVWPFQSSRGLDGVKAYEDRLIQTGKANYIYFNECNEGNSGPFSNVENQIKVSEIFLKYGLKIVSKLRKSTFRPLGFTNTPSFGFGSLCATDFNISNTSPLVLWWGSIDSGQTDENLACWYPLLPRRNNKELYQEVNNYEKEFSVYNYTDVLKTVYRLASIRHQEVLKKEEGFIADFREISINLDETVRERQDSELFQYLNSMNMDTIKVIQTAMYLGCDYRPPEISDEQREEYLERMADDPDFVMPRPSRRVSNPEEVFLDWFEDLTFQKDWKSKFMEVDHIYEKVPLDTYLQVAFEILGI